MSSISLVARIMSLVLLSMSIVSGRLSPALSFLSIPSVDWSVFNLEFSLQALQPLWVSMRKLAMINYYYCWLLVAVGSGIFHGLWLVDICVARCSARRKIAASDVYPPLPQQLHLAELSSEVHLSVAPLASVFWVFGV